MGAPAKKEPDIVRNEKGQFVKGCTPNPSGRNKRFKGMAAYIRSQTDDGRELADFALGVLRNESGAYRHVDRWDALKWLSDRGFGKPIQTQIEVAASDDAEDLPDLDSLDPVQLAEADAEVGKLIAQIRKLTLVE